jgi:hypothetical protein
VKGQILAGWTQKSREPWTKEHPSTYLMLVWKGISIWMLRLVCVFFHWQIADWMRDNSQFNPHQSNPRIGSQLVPTIRATSPYPRQVRNRCWVSRKWLFKEETRSLNWL